MKRLIVLIVTLICLAVLTLGLAAGCSKKEGGVSPSGLKTLRVSHQPEFETFITYQAMQEGLDKKYGLEFKLVYFDSGMPQIEALAADEWDVGATGCVPMLMAALRYGAYMIGIADDESFANVVMARPDNPVFQKKDVAAPGIYGTPDEVKGKTILCTTVSSGHYALSGYLSKLGLKDKDVTIMNLEQAQAVAAFEAGKGDFVALWAPFYYRGLQRGWKVVADGAKVGTRIPLVLIANKKFADNHPEEVVKFLDIYFQGIEKMKKEGKNLADAYQRFLKDWAGMDISKEDAVLDIEVHPVFDLKEQLALFDSSKGKSEVEKWMEGVAEFFTQQGKLTPQEKEKVMKSNFINAKFLETLAKQKGLK